jgi:hypothetical protein
MHINTFVGKTISLFNTCHQRFVQMRNDGDIRQRDGGSIRESAVAAQVVGAVSSCRRREWTSGSA